jgi:beta-lactam-binding protein with PASTA domain
VAVGSPVDLVLAVEKSCYVPDNLYGLTQDEATQALQDTGLTLGTVTTREEASADPGTVLETSPTANTKVGCGTAVNLVLAVEKSCYVPDNLYGLTQAAATEALTGAGLTLGNVSEREDSSAEEGTVLESTPDPGSQATCGSAVDLVLSSGPPCTVTVPHVVGGYLNDDGTDSDLAGVGLVVGKVTERPDHNGPGEIIDSSPTEGTTVACHSAVDLVISSGPAPIAIPDLRGLTVDEATSKLTGLGLQRGGITEQPDATVADGDVINSSPAAGTSVAPGSTVDLTVSTGPAPVDVPDVRGLTVDAATTKLVDAHLTLGTTPSTIYDSDIPKGSVISTTPVAGTSVAPGTPVNLTISAGPAPLDVADGRG